MSIGLERQIITFDTGERGGGEAPKVVITPQVKELIKEPPNEPGAAEEALKAYTKRANSGEPGSPPEPTQPAPDLALF